MKSVVFGARRGAKATREGPGSLDAALAPAFTEGHWHVPGRFNFTRDVVEVLAVDPLRRALTFVGRDGVIEPRTFQQLADGASRWASYLREHDVEAGDRVLVVTGTRPDWPEIVLGCIKLGGVAVPCSESLPAPAVEIRAAAVGARVVVAADPSSLVDLRPATGEVVLIGVEDVRREARRLPKTAETADTSREDPALVVWTAGRTNGPRGATHAQRATFAARVHAEHWLDAGPGDVVWCSAPASSAQALWSSLFGPWSREAEVVLNESPLDPADEIDLVRRLGVTTLCRTPGEYAVLAESDRLERIGTGRLRRLVATGNQLPEALLRIIEARTGLAIHDGYGQAETGVIVGHPIGVTVPPGSLGLPLPGYEVAVIDEQGREVPAGELGDIALRGKPPSLFVGYWEAPTSTRSAFRGDWYVTGDAGLRDEAGFFWLAGRVADLAAEIASVEAEHALELFDELEITPGDALAVTAVSGVEPGSVSLTPVARSIAAEASADPEAIGAAGERPVRIRLWTRLTAVVWVFLLGILVGGVAVPHAGDGPRLAPERTPQPSAICPTPKR